MSYDIKFALHIAKLWRAGKMIGGDEDEVRDAMLGEIERLQGVLRQIANADHPEDGVHKCDHPQIAEDALKLTDD